MPRIAKAQEVTANRLIYGNYLQNYNIIQQNLPDIQTTVEKVDITTVATPEASIKSSRTYQVGGVYIDKYGREIKESWIQDRILVSQVYEAFLKNIN